MVVDRRQLAVVKELAKAALRYEAGEDGVGFGSDEVVRCDGPWRGSLRLCECAVSVRRQQQGGTEVKEKVFHRRILRHH